MLSMNFTGDDMYKSTYNKWFHLTPKDLKPKKIYKEYPSYSDDQTNLAATKRLDTFIRSKKKVRPPTYKRFFPTCLGLGCFGYVPLFNTDKPIVKTLPPREIVNDPKPKPPVAREHKPLKDQTLDEMFLNQKWVSSKTKEDKENPLPIPKFDVPKNTVEDNSDLARHKFIRMEDHIGDWQTAGWSWDRLQLRETRYYEKPDCLRKIDEANLKKAKIASWNRKPESLIPEDIEPFSMAVQSQQRQIPGYMGYVPMEPVECTFDPYAGSFYLTNSKGSYRKFSKEKFEDQHAMVKRRINPFSKMITRVPPHNPFRNLPERTQTVLRARYH